jgi:glycerol-3-phosphate acyltransferase PlsY
MLGNIGALAVGYVVGSISPGALIARYYAQLDITAFGSKSSGATNVARMLGKKYFFVIFALDFFKAFGYLALLGLLSVTHITQLCAAAFLVIGNSYSCFLGFKGGKGIATSVGIILWFVPHIFMILLAVWALSFSITYTVGISSVVSCVFLFFLIIFNQLPLDSIFLMMFISIWGIVRHAENIHLFFSR